MCDKAGRVSVEGMQATQADSAMDYGYVKGANIPSHHRDKIVQQMLMASRTLEMRAMGIRRLAQLVGAMNPHDAELFSVLDAISRDVR